MTVTVTDSPYVEWDEFVPSMKWEQGQHLTAIGPTGSGKTTLTNALLPLRKYVIFAATKKKDSTVDKLVKEQKFRRVKDLGQIHPEVEQRYIYKPEFPHIPAPALVEYHREFFRDLLMYVFRNGGWTVDLDEIRYLTEFLGLQREYELLMLQGRSLKITVISKTQRPKRIPLTAYDQATHLFFWRDVDDENLKRIGGLGGHHDAKAIRREVANLPWHEVLYLNNRSGLKVRTRVPENIAK